MQFTSASAERSRVPEQGSDMRDAATSPSTKAGARDPRTRLRPNAIGVFGIFFFVVAAVGPMAAVLGASPLVFAANGDGAPATYVISAGLFAVFSVGYVAMSRYIGNAGGFVTYIARGFNNRAGAATALVALMLYCVITCGIYGVYGVFAHQTAIDRLGVHLSWQVWALGTVVVVAVLAYRRVELSARVLGLFMAAEVLVLVVLDVAIIGS